MGGRTFKRATLRSTFYLFTRRALRISSAEQFLGKAFPWTSFLLQGLQVSRDWTGYGIQLGTIMGFISDAFWAPFQSIQGEDVTFRAPPKDDPLGKAAFLLAQTPQHMYMKDILTPDEHKMIIAATWVATSMLRAVTPPDYVLSRGVSIGELTYPLFQPWNEASLDAMAKEEVTFDSNPSTGTLPYLPYPYAFQPVQEVIKPLETQVPLWEDRMREVFAADPIGGTIIGYYHNLTWYEQINWINQGAKTPEPPPQDPISRPRLFDYEDTTLPIPEDLEIDWSHAIEYSVFPATNITSEQLKAWLTHARNLSQAKGFRHATFEDLKTAAVEILGGFVRRPFQTYTGIK